MNEDIKQRLLTMVQTNRSGKNVLIEAIKLINELEEVIEDRTGDIVHLYEENQKLKKIINKMNVKVKFVKDLTFWTGNFNEGETCILTKEDAEYFIDYLEIIGETNEEAISFDLPNGSNNT